MLFKDLLKQVDIEDVLRYINSEYDDNSDDAYRLMYYRLLEREPVKEKELKLFVISQLSYFSDIEESDREEFLEVLGYSEKEDTDYALDLTPWDEWLGMEVIQKSVDIVGIIPFVGECLREMSFISFDEEKIDDFREDLAEQVRRIETGEERTYSSEEVREKMRKEFGDDFVEDFMVDRRTEEEKRRDSEEMQRKFEINKKKRDEIRG